MNRSQFAARCASRLLLLDGATGTELARHGLVPGVSPELWVTEHPEAITAVQQAYVRSGSGAVYTATFGGNPFKLAEFGLEKRCEELNEILAGLSRRAVGNDILVFGDMAPTGKLVEPFGELGFEECVAAYRRQASGLLKGGVDGFVIETMLDLQECRAALIAVRDIAPDMPVIVTMTFDESGRTLTGCDPAAALVTLQSLGADAFGCNCSVGPVQMAEVIKKLKPYAQIPLVAKPNAGMPHLEQDKTVFELAPAPFADAAKLLVDAGANLLGGCCGTTPAHIEALKSRTERMTVVPAAAPKYGVIAASSGIAQIAPELPFTIIGERINPTGKKALQAELRAGSLEMVRTFAREQISAGAGVLDVNLGLSGIDEPAMMRRTVALLAQMCPQIPLSIDTTSAEAAEAALRLYPGRALFNSISGERRKVEEILPIVRKYGALPIFLPLTDAGIPKDSNGRIDVLESLLAETEVNDYLVDALVMTVGADLAAPRAALNVISFASKMLKRGTTCGLSNVSFGLPNRPAVNAAFLALAQGYGLSSAIANPCAAGLTAAAVAADSLLGHDPKFTRLTDLAAPAADPAAKEQPKLSLFDAVVAGESEAALAETKELLKTQKPMEIVNQYLIPAINAVGEKFERKEFFLPQLMQGAAAMRTAMDFLKPLLAEEKTNTPSGPVCIIATVEGDIHDIGKNIFSLLLENYGFTVLDLGKDVPNSQVLEAAKSHQAAFIGLSALMTTTMPRMREMAELLKEQKLDIPLFVGGAAVDQEFADSIGAYFAPDAMGSVRLALGMLKK